MKKKLLCLLFALIGSGLAFAQPDPMDERIERPLPKVHKWIDNDHILMSRRETISGKTMTYSFDIRNGKEAFMEYQPVQTKKNKERLITPRYSPDGKWVAFTRENDLYARNLESGSEMRYTRDGSETILNGFASWVYYEEILGRESKHAAIWWSPDSKYIAFYRFDDSRVPMYPLYNASGQHGYTEHTRYPKAGDPNPEVSIGIVRVADGHITWARFNMDTDSYFGTPFWRPDASALMVQWMSREQNNLKLINVSLETGETREVYDEKYPTWINWIKHVTWVKEGFLTVRDFEGWQQIYLHHNDGTLQRLTNGRNWHTTILRIDEKRRRIIYRSNGELSTRTDLYSVGLDGRRQRRLSFGDYTFGNFLFSPDGANVITTYENSHTPTRLAVIRINDGSMRLLADSKGPEFDTASINFPRMEWIETDDGFRLPARVRYPARMEAGKQYPVIIRIYGGPDKGTVKESWTQVRHLEKAENDSPCIQISIDHRGSGHCGKKGMDYMHRNLGKWEINDYTSWAKWLCNKSCVDPNRILISGGSYGGYIAALALMRSPEYFRYAISKYPVTDWMLYDSHYTERYMDLPKDNPEGYKAASVLTYTAGYRSKGNAMLLLIHGMMDDNVHVQNSLQLIENLQQTDKPFLFMAFPNERHGWFSKIAYTNSLINHFIDTYLFDKK